MDETWSFVETAKLLSEVVVLAYAWRNQRASWEIEFLIVNFMAILDLHVGNFEIRQKLSLLEINLILYLSQCRFLNSCFHPHAETSEASRHAPIHVLQFAVAHIERVGAFRHSFLETGPMRCLVGGPPLT